MTEQQLTAAAAALAGLVIWAWQRWRICRNVESPAPNWTRANKQVSVLLKALLAGGAAWAATGDARQGATAALKRMTQHSPAFSRTSG